MMQPVMQPCGIERHLDSLARCCTCMRAVPRHPEIGLQMHLQKGLEFLLLRGLWHRLLLLSVKQLIWLGCCGGTLPFPGLWSHLHSPRDADGRLKHHRAARCEPDDAIRAADSTGQWPSKYISAHYAHTVQTHYATCLTFDIFSLTKQIEGCVVRKQECRLAPCKHNLLSAIGSLLPLGYAE